MKQLMESGVLEDENRQSFNDIVFEGNPPSKSEHKNKMEETREIRDKKINEQGDEYTVAFHSRSKKLLYIQL